MRILASCFAVVYIYIYICSVEIHTGTWNKGPTKPSSGYYTVQSMATNSTDLFSSTTKIRNGQDSFKLITDVPTTCLSNYNING